MDLWIVSDAIETNGVDVEVGEVVMPDLVDGIEGGTVAPVTTSPFAVEEEVISSETMSTESAVATIAAAGKEPETAITEETEDEEEATTTSDETEAAESTAEATTSSTISTSESTSDKSFDASSVITLAADEVVDEQSTQSGASTGAVMGISFAAIVSVFVAAMAIFHIKRKERRRLTEFAGEELVDDDVEANSVHNDVVAIDLAGEKVYAEISPEAASPDNEISDEHDGTSDGSVSSVFSVDREEEGVQISFEEDGDGSMEAKVAVGSSLAALGVASTMTSRLSKEQQQGEQGQELRKQNGPNEV